MKVKKLIAIIIIMILLFNSLYNVSLAVDIKDEKLIESSTRNENIIGNNMENSRIMENITENNSTMKNVTESNTITENDIENIIEYGENNSKEEIKKEDNILDDNDKVTLETKELLNELGIKDVKELSSQITEEKMKNLILELEIPNIDMQVNNNKMKVDSNIIIESNSRNLIEKFINNHTSYTYSINNEGYLICDDTLKINEKLDMIEPEETEVDIAIHNIFKEDKKIYIKVSDIYYNFDNENMMKSVEFDNETKIKAYENEKYRLIFLNSQYYNLDNIDYNLSLSDNFIKSLDNIQYKVLIGEIQLSQEIYAAESVNTYEFTDNGQGTRNCSKRSNCVPWTK